MRHNIPIEPYEVSISIVRRRLRPVGREATVLMWISLWFPEFRVDEPGQARGPHWIQAPHGYVKLAYSSKSLLGDIHTYRTPTDATQSRYE